MHLVIWCVKVNWRALFLNSLCDSHGNGLTVVSVLRLLRKFWMVAVLEVPDSPTSTTGLFTFTICSNSQLARVVSTVGTDRE